MMDGSRVPDSGSVPAPKRIGIAVVEQGGWYLVGTRPEGAPLAGFAEFPGGKCEPGESTAECALRECREETGLVVRGQRLLLRQEHHYPHGSVDLHFWLCQPAEPVELLATCQGFRWCPAHELATLRFPEGNAAVVRLLLGPTPEAG